MEGETNTMLKNGIIRFSESDWACVPVFAKKKDDGLRYTIDLRPVNDCIFADKFPMGNMEEILDKLGKHPRGELRMGLADAYRRLGETEKSAAQLDAILVELPGGKYAKRASEWKAADPGAKLVHNCIGCHTKSESLKNRMSFAFSSSTSGWKMLLSLQRT